MKTILCVMVSVIITSIATSQTTFNNSVTVASGLAVSPTNVYSSGLTVRLPAGSLGYGLWVGNAYSNLLTLNNSGYLMVPAGADLGEHVISKAFWVGDKSSTLIGWPGMITATNTTGPNAYAPFVAKEYWAGPVQGLTTNINVVTDTGTNQLQFTGGILTGVVRQ